jgi:hypothetical protein
MLCSRAASRAVSTHLDPDLIPNPDPAQFGKHHTIRVPHHGRDLAYQPETCELLVGGEGPDCFRLNLERGCFMAPLATGASGINTVAVAPTHGMLALGTADGAVQCWDPRQRSLLGAVSPHESLGAEATGTPHCAVCVLTTAICLCVALASRALSTSK